ncbi:DUF924 domain-containing protein [Oxalobacteraceae sp. CFBP 8763]|nr:DUF924 domain-containing protein [Oxalobacteraceae sp. CFBP 8763]
MDAQEVLDFWFLPASHSDHGKARAEWYRKDPAFDAVIRERFGTTITHAIAGGLREWDEQGAHGVLARILVLDQFTRNVYRGAPESFAGDVLALSAARQMVDAGEHMALAPIERQFIYMPFEHAEDAGMQQLAVDQFTALAADHEGFDEVLDYAHRHRGVIARFGRFPHRNPILGRASTPEELDYLSQPGAGF